jgi:cellulose synthase/poly-beta-1,6-N-acetylglucosamine synthase-like glycosyltransferase
MSIILNALGLLVNLVGIFMLLNVVYLAFFAVAGHWKAAPSAAAASVTHRRMCVLMPAYHADALILETAPAAQRHAYDGFIQVCVIADGLLPTTIQTLRRQQIEVIEVAFDKSTKGKALLAGLETLPTNAYDVAVVLDVDNIMDTSFLMQINQAFEAGYRVVQGHRTAKNFDTPFAVLDACNEEISNHLFRQGQVSLGMSAALIGSGMAFEFSYLKQILQGIGETPGEDKELDFRIAKDGIKVGYLPQAYIYDEKIANSRVFTTQRTRWIAAQLDVLQRHFWEGPVQLWQGNINFFNKVLQTLLVPRMLLIAALSLLLLVSLLGLPGPSPLFWAALLLGVSCALLLSLPARLYNRQVAQAIWHLPLALGAMIIALLQLKKAKASFLPTTHTASHSLKLPQS